jgi:hypothetical protein
MGCSMYADAVPRCPVDLLWYPDKAGELRDDWPLKPGLFALGFRLPEDRSAPHVQALLDCSEHVAGEGKQDETDIHAGRSPGGIRYLLRS